MTSNIPQINTYHCLCSTLLLATPYPLSALPHRAPPSLDRAYILPLPPLSRPSPQKAEDDANESSTNVKSEPGIDAGVILPSLLTQNMRPARKVVVVRREDGFEKRRVHRCGRCGVGVGYEILGQEGELKERVIYLLEGGLVTTGQMGKEEEGT